MIVDELPQDSGTLSDTDMSETGGEEYSIKLIQWMWSRVGMSQRLAPH